MDSYPKGSQALSWPKPLGPHFPLFAHYWASLYPLRAWLCWGRVGVLSPYLNSRRCCLQEHRRTGSWQKCALPTLSPIPPRRTLLTSLSWVAREPGLWRHVGTLHVLLAFLLQTPCSTALGVGASLVRAELQWGILTLQWTP